VALARRLRRALPGGVAVVGVDGDVARLEGALASEGEPLANAHHSHHHQALHSWEKQAAERVLFCAVTAGRDSAPMPSWRESTPHQRCRESRCPSCAAWPGSPWLWPG